MNYEKMTLENVGDGAARREFERALPRVLADLDDETKPHEAPRSITLKITFKPADNSTVSVVVAAAVTLAPTRAFKSHAVLGHDGALHQYRDQQEELPLSPNVREFPAPSQKGGEG